MRNNPFDPFLLPAAIFSAAARITDALRGVLFCLLRSCYEINYTDCAGWFFEENVAVPGYGEAF